ncbi:MAG: hypothetical protein ACT4ON_10365 [Bacteroidota bacterium]
MQFSKNFGKVIYLKAEDGFAPNFQQKIKSLGADIRTGKKWIRI